MTTQPEIKLPPLPAWMSSFILPPDSLEGEGDKWLDEVMQSYARQCVLADRASRGHAVDEADLFNDWLEDQWEKDALTQCERALMWNAWRKRARLAAPTQERGADDE